MFKKLLIIAMVTVWFHSHPRGEGSSPERRRSTCHISGPDNTKTQVSGCIDISRT